jgi:hypothetical protein
MFGLIIYWVCLIIDDTISSCKLRKKIKETKQLNLKRASEIKVGTKLRKTNLNKNPFISPSYKDIEILDIKNSYDGTMWYQYKETLGGLKTLEACPAEKIIDDHSWEILK